MINREDMLELTRRMTPARLHIDRIAGAYYDAEGKQIQKRIVLQPGLFDSIQKLPDTSRFSPGFRNPVILQLFVGLCL